MVLTTTTVTLRYYGEAQEVFERVPRLRVCVLPRLSLHNSLFTRNTKIKIYEYKTIILPDALYGCEARSLTQREEHKLRVIVNRVLRTVCEPKREEVVGDWRRS